MKLSADLINNSPSFINTVKDRELDLRENKIPAIENIGASKDLNDCLDLSNNDLKVLDNFPLLPRLRCILASNNRIQKIDSKLGEYLPNLESLILTNNNIEELGELVALQSLKRLTRLSFLDNPVTRKKYYREWVIFKVPTLRILDFQKVRQKERASAIELFLNNGESSELASAIEKSKSKTFEPGRNLSGTAVPAIGISNEEKSRIKEAIKNAKSLDEVNHLERLLRTGHVPEKQRKTSDGTKPASNTEDVEMS